MGLGVVANWNKDSVKNQVDNKSLNFELRIFLRFDLRLRKNLFI